MGNEDLIKSLEELYEKCTKVDFDNTFSRLSIDISNIIFRHNEINTQLYENKAIRRTNLLRFNELRTKLSKMTQIRHHLLERSSARQFIGDYKDTILSIIEDLETIKPTRVPSKDIESITTKSNNKVFIIHGHDETNKLRLKSILEDEFKLKVVLLNLKAGKGRTLIEKFEQEASKTSYAFALFTPDDLKQVDDTEVFEARPNVIFELGWFYGRIGRNRVTIIYKEGTNKPSDLDGISRIQFIDNVEDKFLEIQRELEEAGLIKSVKNEES